MTDVRSRIDVVPLTPSVANEIVRRIHRHHAPVPPGLPWFAVGAVVDGVLVGCAIAGRPSNRNNDDRQTVEVLRLATDGTPNAPSALLGSCARAARAIGAARIITYTLDSEGGASLRGAGWVREKDGIQSAWTMGYTRTHAVSRPHYDEEKVRWALNLRDPIEYVSPFVVVTPDDHQLPLFGEVAE